MTIGENIRRIRKEKNLTQKQLSELTNGSDNRQIAEVTIRKYESGKIIPKQHTVRRIANALGVPMYELDESLKDLFGKLEELDNQTNLKKIHEEIALCEIISSEYGDLAINLLEDFQTLNDTGKQKAVEYTADLKANPKYQK